jgi:hypothetical protein
MEIWYVVVLLGAQAWGQPDGFVNTANPFPSRAACESALKANPPPGGKTGFCVGNSTAAKAYAAGLERTYPGAFK